MYLWVFGIIGRVKGVLGELWKYLGINGLLGGLRKYWGVKGVLRS